GLDRADRPLAASSRRISASDTGWGSGPDAGPTLTTDVPGALESLGPEPAPATGSIACGCARDGGAPVSDCASRDPGPGCAALEADCGFGGLEPCCPHPARAPSTSAAAANALRRMPARLVVEPAAVE